VGKYEAFEIISIYIRAIKFLLVVSIIIFSLFYKNISYALGFVLGGTACLLNFNLMIRSLEGIVSRTTYSRAFFNGHFTLRLAVTLTVLTGAMLLESVNLFTAVAGIFTIRIVIAWEAMTWHIKSLRSLE